MTAEAVRATTCLIQAHNLTDASSVFQCSFSLSYSVDLTTTMSFSQRIPLTKWNQRDFQPSSNYYFVMCLSTPPNLQCSSRTTLISSTFLVLLARSLNHTALIYRHSGRPTLVGHHWKLCRQYPKRFSYSRKSKAEMFLPYTFAKNYSQNFTGAGGRN